MLYIFYYQKEEKKGRKNCSLLSEPGSLDKNICRSQQYCIYPKLDFILWILSFHPHLSAVGGIPKNVSANRILYRNARAEITTAHSNIDVS